jgi:hypothetical protein
MFLSLLRWLSLAAAAVLATGCASIDDPRAGREQRQGQPVALGKVLVVVDYRADMQANGNREKDAPALDQLYAPAADAMSAAVTAAGGQPTVAYVRFNEDLPQTAGYSHVWVQRLQGLSRVTQQYITYTKYRSWVGTISHRSDPGAALQVAYQSDYSSDGVMCFTATRWANRDQCQASYKAFVAGQLQKYRGS